MNLPPLTTDYVCRRCRSKVVIEQRLYNCVCTEIHAVDVEYAGWPKYWFDRSKVAPFVQELRRLTELIEWGEVALIEVRQTQGVEQTPWDELPWDAQWDVWRPSGEMTITLNMKTAEVPA